MVLAARILVLSRAVYCSLPKLLVPVAKHRVMGGAASFFWGGSSDSMEERVDMNSPEAQFIQAKIKENCVMVFSKTTCSYCRMAKNILQEVGAPYEVIELNQVEHGDKYARVLGEITGARTVPRVFINGKCIGGGSETKQLHQQGKLASLIQECGIGPQPQSKI